MEIAIAPVAFSHFPWSTGRLATLDRQFPSYLQAVDRGGAINLEPGDTHFGVVHDGEVYIGREVVQHRLCEGEAFSIAGGAHVRSSVGGRAVIVSREDWLGFNYITGPIEQKGRLRYIDGCTDSLLIPPVRLGDPCLNLLYFPPGIDQTARTHPSDRIGLILSGRGRCHAWDEQGGWQEKLIDLEPGMILCCIHTNGKHKFSTPYGEEMRVLAYHPDSDFGPRDEDHPMLNRTIVDGVSAREIDAIRTK